MVNLQRCKQLAIRARTLGLAGQPPRTDEQPADWFRVSLEADETRATILVYGEIGGWWGVDVDQLVAQIHGLKVEGIDVHINSQGGNMFDGFSLYAALLQHPSHVTTWVDGIAASAASIVFVAGDVRKAEKPARVMIHRSAMSPGWSNEEELTETAALLREFDQSMADIYADRAGGDPETFLAAMKAETFYSSAAAVDVGLAHEVIDRTPAKPAPESRASQLIRARRRALSTLGGVSTK